MLVYISGKYTGDVEANIQAARKVAIELWEKGYAAHCPHLNTAHFHVDCKATYDDYIKGDLVILMRCDAILVLPGWEESNGTGIELEYAREHNIPIYYYPELPTIPITEVRCPQQCEAFINVVMKLYRVHLKKNADYSPANILGTGKIGLVTRLWDKMARIMALTGFVLTITESEFIAPKEASCEPLEDSFLDLSNYGIIADIYNQGKWGK